jgi:hypothetical protein
MSNKPHHCDKCKIDYQCQRVAPFGRNDEAVFGVMWECPGCKNTYLIVSPIGPLLTPTADMCLQCGHRPVGIDQACRECGTVLSDLLGPAQRALSDDQLLMQARDAFVLGTCRLGLTIVNFVLQRNPQQSEAWSIKGQFLEYLGFQEALKTAMQEAVRVTKKRPWWQFWA